MSTRKYKPIADPAPRGRNASATRQAILESALTAFAQSGYDHVGVREIAQGAGVTAMLVNRYFGSKEQLFAEAVDGTFANRGILTDDLMRRDGDVSTLGWEIAEALVS